nr:RecName: Full=Potassium channel toxin kappa-KTx 2.8; AltName: Full=HSP053C.2; AltName: Full=Toxin HeTx204; AltName: Full=Toxin kappa-KTx 2.7; Flags: Precursor [Heterometrus petersii]
GTVYVFLLLLAFGIFTDISNACSEQMDDEDSYEVEKRGNACIEVCLQHTGNPAECDKPCDK